MDNIIFTFPTINLLKFQKEHRDWYALVKFNGDYFLTECFDRDECSAVDAVIDYLWEIDQDTMLKWREEAENDFDAIVYNALQEKMPNDTFPETPEARMRILLEHDLLLSEVFEEFNNKWDTGGNCDDRFPAGVLGEIKFVCNDQLIFGNGLDPKLKNWRDNPDSFRLPEVYLGKYNDKIYFYYDARTNYVTPLGWTENLPSGDVNDSLEKIKEHIFETAKMGADFSAFSDVNGQNHTIKLIKDEDWDKVYTPSAVLREFYNSHTEDWSPYQPAWITLRNERIAQHKMYIYKLRNLFDEQE